MTEREQLELCAKAAVIDVTEVDGRIVHADTSFNDCPIPWNPLTSDGDCGRLEAKLGIDIMWNTERVECSVGLACKYEHVSAYDDHNGDKQAARRAAVCAVAAEIGGRMS